MGTFVTPYHAAIHEQLPIYREFALKFFPEARTRHAYIDQLEFECESDFPLPKLLRRWGVLFGFMIGHCDFPEVYERKRLAKVFDPLDDAWENFS